MFCIIQLGMIQRLLVNHSKLDVSYKLSTLGQTCKRKRKASTCMSHTKSLVSCPTILHTLSPAVAYSWYTVNMECAISLKCCRPVSHPSIPSRSLKQDFLMLLFLLLITMPVTSMCSYCLNREPHFFENTPICCRLFSLARYFQATYTTAVPRKYTQYKYCQATHLHPHNNSSKKVSLYTVQVQWMILSDIATMVANIHITFSE